MCSDVVIPPKKPKLSKRERRELQEAQRAAKAAGTRLPKPGSNADAESDSKGPSSSQSLSRGSEASIGIRLQYDDKKKVAKRSKNAVIQRTKAQKQVRGRIIQQPPVL